MTVKICASITAQTMTELADMVLKSERGGADLIEVRMDFFREAPDIGGVRDLTSLPLIATNRLKKGGDVPGDSEEKRMSYLFAAALGGFEYVDLELETPMLADFVKKLREESKIKLIISHHDFQSTPSLDQLNQIFRKEMNVGADVCKIVTTANTFEDNLPCLLFAAQASKMKDVICFCMGSKGIPSRLFSPLLGGYLTYASVERGREAASGQLTIEETREFYGLLKP